MAIDREYLRQHYASLSDESLAAVERDDLVEAAQKVYDEERAKRGLAARQKAAAPTPPVAPPVADDSTGEDEDGEPPDWIEGAECACEFYASGRTSADRANTAQNALQAGGIPCYVSTEEVPPEPPPVGPQYTFRVLVPQGLSLRAQALLDQEIFNAEWEAGFKTHLEELSDDALDALSPEIVCAALTDKIERLTRLYHEEVARRKTAG